MSEGGDSSFSMKGVLSSLKTKVKAKFHELSDYVKDGFKRPASEQQYAEPVSPSKVDVEPTHEELNDVTRAASRLWALDLNRLTPGRDYQIDVGEGKKVYQKGDVADGPLFRHVDKSVFNRPTYSRFYALLDNYHADEQVAERMTAHELNEETAFIEEISRTAPIQYLYRYLSAKNIIQGDEPYFKQALLSLWFHLYSRGGTRGSSSAFEHVFVGEIKHERGSDNVQVSGLHNWIQFYVEEAKGAVNYLGFIFPRRRSDPQPNSDSQLLTLQFEWNGVLKPVSTSLIGVSPEFELALYTLCYFNGREDNRITLGPYYVNIKVYPLGKNSIGSAFPVAEQ